MIFGEHELGVFGDLTVTGPDGYTLGALMTITVGPDGDMGEPLTRPDVERLRDLCDEALS